MICALEGMMNAAAPPADQELDKKELIRYSLIIHPTII